jgi:hypothetical protein
MTVDCRTPHSFAGSKAFCGLIGFAHKSRWSGPFVGRGCSASAVLALQDGHFVSHFRRLYSPLFPNARRKGKDEQVFGVRG